MPQVDVPQGRNGKHKTIVTKILSDQRANIVETIHNRAYYGVNLGDTVIDITLETRGAAHITAIAQALESEGYRYERIQ